jgi:prolipoprotein diacylglyceryltransferase
MWSDLYVVGLAVFLAVILSWAFRKLPKEEWQVLAAVPSVKRDSETWCGINYTYYGLLVALSCTFSTGLALVLMGSVGIPGRVGLLVVAVVLCVCMPTARIMARIVEKRLHTLTIAGPAFIGVVAAPGIVWAADLVLSSFTNTRIPMFPALAAFSIAYAMGEGFGRLACISFGCCYGKPLAACHPILQRVFDRHGFVFSGKTKKIAYESGLEGEPVIPIQAMTSTLFIAVAILGMLLYFRGWYAEALIVTLSLTQAWRIVSEALRSDYRGGGSWSAYQGLAVLAILYAGAMYFILPRGFNETPALASGLTALWDPTVILSLQILFAVTFLWTGRSTVTASTMEFQIVKKNI